MKTISKKEACESSIIIAADGIEKLRKQDVSRVIEDFFFGVGSSAEIVDYISENRPDLAEEARACQLELVPAVDGSSLAMSATFGDSPLSI